MIQGTLGLYDEARSSVYLEGKSPEYHQWEPFPPYQDEYDHSWWKSLPAEKAAAGHGGTGPPGAEPLRGRRPQKHANAHRRVRFGHHERHHSALGAIHRPGQPARAVPGLHARQVENSPARICQGSGLALRVRSGSGRLRSGVPCPCSQKKPLPLPPSTRLEEQGRETPERGTVDPEIVERARRGDGEALEVLLEWLTPPLLKFASRLCGDAALAEELVTEALYRGAVKLKKLREPTSVEPWFRRIVVNFWRDRLRKRGRRELLLEEHPEPPLPPVTTRRRWPTPGSWQASSRRRSPASLRGRERLLPSRWTEA